MGNVHTCGPNEALFKNGCGGQKIGVGRSVFAWWFCEQVERFDLGLKTIEVLSRDAETAQGVRVNVVGIAQVKVKAFKPNPEAPDGIEVDYQAIDRAATLFLGDDVKNVTQQLQQTLEGQQRQILGQLTVEELFKDRQRLSSSLREHVVDELNELGFELASYVVQDVDDDEGYLDSLGKTQIALVKRQAEEGQAMHLNAARRTVAACAAEADTEEAVQGRHSHLVVNLQQEEKAESDRDLNLKQSTYNKEVSQARAEAGNAGRIEEAKQMQRIVREKTTQRKVEEEVRLGISELVVARSKKEREGNSLAELLAEGNRAKGIEVLSNADADKIRFRGAAEADVIVHTGQAESAVLESKAHAFKQFGEAAVVEMLIRKMPDIAGNLAAPLCNTEKIVFVSDSSKPRKSKSDQLMVRPQPQQQKGR